MGRWSVVGLRTQVWQVFSGRGRTKGHIPSGCLPYRQPYIQPELAYERRSAAIPLGSKKRLFQILMMGFQTIRFLQQFYYSWEVAQMRLFNCLCGRKHLATGQRKPDFFRRCFIPKAQLFCHTFLSLSQGWKVFGSNNCRACKRHGFQHSVSDEPNETDPWQL